MKKIKSLFITLITLSFISCATTLTVQVPRAAELDLTAINSIAIEPVELRGFSANINYFSSTQVSSEIERILETTLTNGGYYKIIGVKDRRTPADMYIDCYITRLSVIDTKTNEKIKNPNYKKGASTTTSNQRRIVEPEYIYENLYRRKVSFDFTYQYVEGYTERVIYSKSFSYDDASGSYKDSSSLPSVYSMISGHIREITNIMVKQIQPYSVTKSFTLLKSKDENMKYADKLADQGYIQDSYNQFITIYNNTGMFEAGYNAALILEAQGKFVEARNLMKIVYDNSLDPRAYKELNNIDEEIRLQKNYLNQNKKRK